MKIYQISKKLINTFYKISFFLQILVNSIQVNLRENIE
jgi:hypothetical protein